ncbi:Cof-type HAD-IIB family hydrolase [Martelella alba]|uniref:Cof-type HAD-IIB family hydrolase n=1 Tax=Martelella alba TaxID=2590451 RepID=UPI001485585F|nr:Cof-type HAD-IIB family hydrolase [Martelella alba]
MSSRRQPLTAPCLTRRGRLLVFDLDGTVLTPEKTVTPRFKDAVRRAVSQDVVIALASGRSLLSVQGVMAQLPLGRGTGYAIACNGALLWRSRPEKLLVSDCLEHRDVLILNELGRQLGYACYLLEENRLLTGFPVTPGAGGYRFASLPVVGLPEGWQRAPRRPPKMMFIDTAERIDALPGLIPAHLAEAYHFVRSEPNYYEVMKKGVHKGSALRGLSRLLGIPAEGIIAVGDADNDREMLKFAGMGVAMGNASVAIKSLADWVTDSNENDGAAKVLEFLLDRQWRIGV